MPTRQWSVFKFTHPRDVEKLGEVAANHFSHALMSAAKQWPELATPTQEYPSGRLHVHATGMSCFCGHGHE